MSNSKKLQGGTGRTSVAELVLARSRLLGIGRPAAQPGKPNVQAVNPPALPFDVGDQPDPLIGSEKHKEMIFREGDENRAHYLAQQAEDGGLMPWFRYVRKESQYSEFVTLDTDMAKQLLENIWTESDGNRSVKLWLKDGYKRDLEADRWVPSDEAIGIDYKGVVYNGRHRLTALVETGKKWPFYVTFNVLEEAKFTVDSGAKRNAAEKLRMVLDTKLGTRVTGFCKAIMQGLQYKVRYTETEVAEFAHKWQPLITWVGLHLPGARAEVQAAVAKSYLWNGPTKVEAFCARLRDVKFVTDGDPARALFFALQRQKINRINVKLASYKKTLSSLDADLSDKPLSRLYERDEDVFQWQEGWELPRGSWWASQATGASTAAPVAAGTAGGK